MSTEMSMKRIGNNYINSAYKYTCIALLNIVFIIFNC